jgi:hypothetical protein
MTGFESGMLGISLFGSAYGLSQVGYFAVVDLGHELFIWFFFLALLLAKRDGIRSPGRLFGAFIRSPVIIASLPASSRAWRVCVTLSTTARLSAG